MSLYSYLCVYVCVFEWCWEEGAIWPRRGGGGGEWRARWASVSSVTSARTAAALVLCKIARRRSRGSLQVDTQRLPGPALLFLLLLLGGASHTLPFPPVFAVTAGRITPAPQQSDGCAIFSTGPHARA